MNRTEYLAARRLVRYHGRAVLNSMDADTAAVFRRLLTAPPDRLAIHASNARALAEDPWVFAPVMRLVGPGRLPLPVHILQVRARARRLMQGLPVLLVRIDGRGVEDTNA